MLQMYHAVMRFSLNKSEQAHVSIQSFYYLIHFGVEEKEISFSPRQNELGNRSFELGNRIGNRKGNRE